MSSVLLRLLLSFSISFALHCSPFLWSCFYYFSVNTSSLIYKFTWHFTQPVSFLLFLSPSTFSAASMYTYSTPLHICSHELVFSLLSNRFHHKLYLLVPGALNFSLYAGIFCFSVSKILLWHSCACFGAFFS